MKTRYTIILLITVAVATLSFSFKDVMSAERKAVVTVQAETSVEPIGGFVIDEVH